MAENNELERTLWAAADKMRSNMDAAEYKHVVLGLIFLKYISDAFIDLYQKLKGGTGDFEGANPEDPDEYLAHNIFFVPEKARRQYLQDRAKQPEIGRWVDEAMEAIEKINPPLKNILPKI
jgi:type I restriction enzyme M protein